MKVAKLEANEVVFREGRILPFFFTIMLSFGEVFELFFLVVEIIELKSKVAKLKLNEVVLQEGRILPFNPHLLLVLT